MIQVGVGVADITPEPGLPLSGFAFRANQPSTHIDDLIQVRALALCKDHDVYLLVSYELLGVGSQAQEQIFAQLNQDYPDIPKENCILTAVHNHSAPCSMPLQGEAPPDEVYLRFVSRKTSHAVGEALRTLQPVEPTLAQKKIAGLTYNRRAVLADGRVSMALEPDGDVVQRGPLDQTLTLIVFRNPLGANVAGLVHFACHGVAVCTLGITHDAPGRVALEIEKLLGVPCLYLQGGAGDLNPTVVSSAYERLDEWTARFRDQIQDLPDHLRSIPAEPLSWKKYTIPVRYQDLPPRDAAAAYLDLLHKVAAGHLDAPEVQVALRNIANILNLPPGELPQPHQATYFAGALVSTYERILAAIDSGSFTGETSMEAARFRLGDAILVFAGAEMFAQAGLRVRQMRSDTLNLLVTYAGPVVGYIPDDASIDHGGYEASDAWMFYGQPAPFRKGALESILATIQDEILSERDRLL